MKENCRSTVFQRTANSELTGCLSRGVHRKTLALGAIRTGENKRQPFSKHDEPNRCIERICTLSGVFGVDANRW